MKKYIALLLLFSFPAYADNAVKVKTGDIVKPEYNEGTLLDKEKAEKIKDQLIERDGFQKENESYKKTVELYKANETIYMDQKDMLLKQNIELSGALNDSRSTSNWERLAYVLLGIGITALAVKGAQQLR